MQPDMCDIGAFSDGKEDHMTVKTVDGDILGSWAVPGGLLAPRDWREVKIRFDVKHNHCDILLDGEAIMNSTSFGDKFKIPSVVCLAVCGAAHDNVTMIAVNDVRLLDVEVD